MSGDERQRLAASPSRHTPAGVTPHPRGARALLRAPVQKVCAVVTRDVRRSYLAQPWRYSGDVAGITGGGTRERSGEEGGEKRKSQRCLIPPGLARYHHFCCGRAGGRAGARRTAAAVAVDAAAPHRIVGSVVLARLRRLFSKAGPAGRATLVPGRRSPEHMQITQLSLATAGCVCR